MQTRNWMQNKKKVAKWAADLVESKEGFIVVDTETTGTGPQDEVVQIGVVEYMQGEVNVLLECLVRPLKVVISPAASDITGITMDTVRHAPFINAYREVLEYIFHNRRLIAYNADFDERLLRQSFNATGHPFPFEIECAMLAYAKFYGEWNDYRGDYRWQKLVAACKQQNIPVVDAHRAAGDCIMTCKVMEAMGEAHYVRPK